MSTHIGKRIDPAPGQESVWDYPRPPGIESVAERIWVVFNGKTIADTTSALRVLETSHPPTYYVPTDDISPAVLIPCGRRSMCEWKGQAQYFDVAASGKKAKQAAWSYPDPAKDFAIIQNHVAFYAQHMDDCFVGLERVRPQDGDFYGGWVTRKVVGPFKGTIGTQGW
jgi:uncharacterized protein (DUF427 family)